MRTYLLKQSITLSRNSTTMSINYIALAASSIIPLIIGIIWYHPKFMGITWRREAGITEEKIRN